MRNDAERGKELSPRSLAVGSGLNDLRRRGLKPTLRKLDAMWIMFGDPPFNPVGGLKAEHCAALVAEFERDPYQYDLWTDKSKRENSTAGDDGQDPPDGPNQPPVSVENLPEDNSRAEGAT